MLFNGINRILRKFGHELVKIKSRYPTGYQPVHDPATSFMVDEKHTELLILELDDIARPFLSENLAACLPKECSIRQAIESFYQVHSARPFRDNTGGSGFHNSFWLFLLARLMQPELIVESGVWKGHSSWLLGQACPNAKIHGFDIDLGHLEYRDEKIVYHENDWSQHEFGEIDPEKSLCFFDCHVSHARRIVEAYERGFRHLLFDDNPPDYKLYNYRLPGFPTANMIVNSHSSKNQTISWHWHGTLREYKVDWREMEKARRVVRRHIVLPDVGGPTRYGGFSFLSYVELVPKGWPHETH